MYLHIFIFSVLLFFVLTPGVLLRLPPNGSKYLVAAVHALVFASVSTMSLKYYKENPIKESMRGPHSTGQASAAASSQTSGSSSGSAPNKNKNK